MRTISKQTERRCYVHKVRLVLLPLCDPYDPRSFSFDCPLSVIIIIALSLTLQRTSRCSRSSLYRRSPMAAEQSRTLVADLPWNSFKRPAGLSTCVLLLSKHRVWIQRVGIMDSTARFQPKIDNMTFKCRGTWITTLSIILLTCSVVPSLSCSIYFDKVKNNIGFRLRQPNR